MMKAMETYLKYFRRRSKKSLQLRMVSLSSLSHTSLSHTEKLPFAASPVPEITLCHLEMEAEKSRSTAALSPLLSELPPWPPSTDHCPLLIQELADQGGKSEMGSHIIEGFLYEIDHVHLPPRTPSQLRSLRVAMVCEKTALNIGISFPSMASLSAFFNYSTRETHPTLDEKFVMGKALAAKVLNKLVPAEIYSQQKRLESFWLISSIAAEMCKDHGTAEEKKGSCFSVLKGNGMVTWGSRRQVKYLGRHKENDSNDGNAQNSSSSFRGDKSEERDSVEKVQNGNSEEGIDGVGDDSRELDEEEEDEEEEVREEEENDSVDDHENSEEENEEEENEANNLKRKRYSFRNLGVKKLKVETREVKKEKGKQKSCKKQIKDKLGCKEAQILRDPKVRWSAERYKLAEKNLFGVMKLKGATAEKPILRPQLRVEARKKIGDTGLLDHLLKHMAGRLAPGGQERFRRRHNPDGAMEYWLEKAGLVKIRKDAGVEDPYWVPPPGWKPGDSPNQDPICARELKLLKDEVCNIKREMVDLMTTKMQLDEEVGKLRRELEEINSKRKQEEYLAITTKSPSNYGISQKLDELDASLVGNSPVSVEKCQEQLMAISDLVKEIEKKIKQGGLGKLTGHVEERVRKNSSLMVLTDAQTKDQTPMAALMTARGETKGQNAATPMAASTEKTPPGSKPKGAAEEKAAKIQRLKSGFRICKPQGTFLWPNMVKDNSCSINSSSNKIMSAQVEVPTPPSVSSSSASNPPKLPYHQSHNLPSLVKPLAGKRAVSVTTISQGTSYEDGLKNYVSSATSIDLNDVPMNPSDMPLLAYGVRNSAGYDQKKYNTGCCSSVTSSNSLTTNWFGLYNLKSNM